MNALATTQEIPTEPEDPQDILRLETAILLRYFEHLLDDQGASPPFEMEMSGYDFVEHITNEFPHLADTIRDMFDSAFHANCVRTIIIRLKQDILGIVMSRSGQPTSGRVQQQFSLMTAQGKNVIGVHTLNGITDTTTYADEELRLEMVRFAYKILLEHDQRFVTQDTIDTPCDSLLQLETSKALAQKPKRRLGLQVLRQFKT